MANPKSALNSPPISLQFIDLSYRPPQTQKPILHGISGSVSSGELLAVLGPSGSGKSTLLTLLAHRLPSPHGGTLLANGRPLSRSLSRRISFVPQADILYPHLTVRETLTYCAMLKLPRSDPPIRRKIIIGESVDAVLEELGLEDCAGRMVGRVSGGERKRVSIGHEMVLDPSVVVVDEATSGLDSTAAGRVVETLVGMARRGRAVVASLHQPGSAAYKLFDVLLLLGEGSCLYYGRGRDAVDYFGSLGFAMGIHVNPADFMLDLANGVAQIDYKGDAEEKKSNVKQSLISSFDRLLAPKVKAAINASITASIASSKATAIGCEKSMDRKEAKDFTRISWLTQFSILLHRSLKERRHETFNSLRILQVVAVAFLAGSMWWHSSINNVHDRLGLLFFISIFWGVFASFNAVFTFPQEKPIFIKERSSGMYSLSSYFAVRMAGDLPMELILPSAFSTVLYWMAGLRPELGAFLLTLLVLMFYVLVAQGLGLALGAIVMDAKQASTMVTIIMLGFLLTGGFYVQNVPASMGWVKYLSFTFYCFRLLIGIQYKDGMSSYLGKEDQAEGIIETQVSVLVSVAALLGMFVVYRVMAYAALRMIKV